METIEIKEKVSSNGYGTLAEVMAQLVKEAENVIEDIGEEVKQELADEITIIKDKFEKKKNQIMEKAKKNAGDQTIKISDKIREVLTVEIKQASTNKISEVFEQANHELEDLVKFSSAPATEDKIPAGEPGISKAEGKNVVETEYFDKVADNGSKDEITISTINIEDETEPKHNFNGWLK